MSIQTFLKRRYYRAKAIFADKKKIEEQKVVDFKKGIWQTDEISQAFIKGSDGQAIVAADIMDKEINDFFLSHCTIGDSVLDIGCGHGIVSEFLAERGINVTAVDISEKLLDDLRRRTEGKNLLLKIKQADAYHLPYNNQTFDVVVARMFLPHFPDWPIVLKEMSRITKRHGKLLVHFSSKENAELGKKIGLHDCNFASSPTPSDPWTFYAEADTKDINKAAAGAGLKLIERTPVSFFLHNRILGYQLGEENFKKYSEQILEFLKDEKVRDFAVWFDREIISKCTPAISHFNIITFKKL